MHLPLHAFDGPMLLGLVHVLWKWFFRYGVTSHVFVTTVASWKFLSIGRLIWNTRFSSLEIFRISNPQIFVVSAGFCSLSLRPLLNESKLLLRSTKKCIEVNFLPFETLSKAQITWVSRDYFSYHDALYMRGRDIVVSFRHVRQMIQVCSLLLLRIIWPWTARSTGTLLNKFPRRGCLKKPFADHVYWSTLGVLSCQRWRPLTYHECSWFSPLRASRLPFLVIFLSMIHSVSIQKYLKCRSGLIVSWRSWAAEACNATHGARKRESGEPTLTFSELCTICPRRSLNYMKVKMLFSW